MEKNNIVLKSHQYEHYDRLNEILFNSFIAVDLSVMGSGKTFVASKICIDLGLKAFICCPKSVIETRKVIKQTYNLPLVDLPNKTNIVSYETFRSNNEGITLTGLLEKKSVYINNKKNNICFNRKIKKSY